VTAFNGYPFSIFLAVVLHCSVLASLFVFQRANTEVLDVVSPPAIKATLVGENPQVKNSQVQQQRQTRRVEEQRAEQRRAEEQQIAAREEQQRQEAERRTEQERNTLQQRQELERNQQAERQKEAEEQKQREERQEQAKQEQERKQQEKAAEQERARQEQALQAQKDADASEIAAQESEAVMSYTSLIHDLVQQNWSRPPSARNGMVTVLRITLAPTGDILDVVIEQSSGDFAFDRAADTAVRKVNRFNELQGMPYSLFERNFRSFRLTFRPEDLLN
jgi:colicin import membrane protein